MAKRSKRKAPRRAAKQNRTRKRPGIRASARRPTRKKAPPRPKARVARKAASRARRRLKPAPRLNRARRVLAEPEADTLRTPPSSLDLNRHASAASSGRHELDHNIREHAGMTPALTGGDVDADWENAYFSGDEAPGGDNPTPDQDVVEEIGHSLGVDYQDSEELRGSDKVAERDKHRWELDPASSDDYKDRK